MDILLGVPPRTDLSSIAEVLIGLGYECLGEAGVPGRLYLRRRNGDAFNATVTTVGERLWCDNLVLRDYLRQSDAARRRYAAAKRAAVQEGNSRLLDYGDVKSPIVDELLAQAWGWRTGRSGPPSARSHGKAVA